MTRIVNAARQGVSEAGQQFNLAEIDAMQSRVQRHGMETLTETETLALYISRSHPQGATDAARTLLRRFGDMQHVLGAHLPELEAVVGPDVALDLKILHDVSKRALAYPVLQRCVITSWTQLLHYLRVAMAGDPRETFRVLFLDKKNKLIADEVMGVGTIDFAPVYPREIVRRALELNALAIILAHNHPTGDPTPSMADIQMTKQVQTAAKALSITLHDHVIVGGDRTVSMKADGLLPA